MSQLAEKKLLVIGEKTKKISEIIEKLSKLNVETVFTEPNEVTSEHVAYKEADFIILNCLKNKELSANILDLLNGHNLSEIKPIFALIDVDTKNIENVLVKGAADYISETEKIDSILQKMEAVFNDSDIFSSASAIDITPAKINLTASGLKVFIIEDDPLLRNLLSIRMERSSFPTEFSNDGKNVVPMMKQFKPDAIILDLMLPGISGFEILSKIKSEPTLVSIPVIVFSNKDGADERREAEELGADAFYVKAMTDLAELIEKIEALVDKNK